MRKIINSTYITLDGDIANMQDWHFEYFDDDATAAAQRFLERSDDLIMGRATYEGFAEAWAPQKDENPFAAKINTMPKHVVSTTLSDPEWENSRVIAVDDVPALKNGDGGDILQYGFGDVSRALVREGLLDELHLWVHPVLSGKAAPEERIYADMPQARFELAGVERLGSGIVILSYAARAR